MICERKILFDECICEIKIKNIQIAQIFDCECRVHIEFDNQIRMRKKYAAFHDKIIECDCNTMLVCVRLPFIFTQFQLCH